MKVQIRNGVLDIVRETMESNTSSGDDREGRVKLRSIGVQTDLRLAIRCTCEKARDELAGQGAKKTVKGSPKEIITAGTNGSVGNANKPKLKPSRVTQATAEVGVSNNALGTPSENSKSLTESKSSKKKGKRNLSQKGCSENSSVDSGNRDRQEQQQQQQHKQTANISARLGTKGGLDADTSNRNHGNKAGCNNSTGNKQAAAAAASEKKIGQSASDSPKPISRPAKKSIGKTGGSLATGSTGVNNYTIGERDINANVRTSRLVPDKMEQSQAGSSQPPTARCHHEPKPPQEQLNQKHVPDMGNELVNAYSKLALDKQNKGAHRRLADQPAAVASAPFSTRSMNLNDEQQQQQSQCETGGGNGGRNIIYLTNRDQYELRAKLIVEAVPFRMPGS